MTVAHSPQDKPDALIARIPWHLAHARWRRPISRIRGACCRPLTCGVAPRVLTQPCGPRRPRWDVIVPQVARADLAERERTLLAECLSLAMALAPRAAAVQVSLPQLRLRSGI